MTEQISFDKTKYEALKKRYEQAVKDDETEFEFEDRTWVTGYAKYALQYLKPRFEGKQE